MSNSETKRRERVKSRDKICTAQKGCTNPTAEAHHWYRAGPLRNDVRHMQGLCFDCHHTDGHNQHKQTGSWPSISSCDGIKGPFRI